ncbi:3682_t:CDS:2 [Paraglomus brasilianum]|uniref:Proteasome subunit beta n=1 Tax=Paraglomus brasilianum TaxID=144538 RepID=A0A9N8WPL8_9GLOM|nr:3682_t:CDS:2 [Paraglomus brasilianum]
MEVGLKPGEISLGTTLIAVAFDGGVVVGADSRTSMGGSYTVNRVTDKLTYVSDRIYCCRSGSAADTQAVASIVTYYLQLYAIQHEEEPPVRVAASLFQELCYKNKDALSAGIICAGWDKHDGGSVFGIPMGGSMHKLPYATAGSGSTYIYGYCDTSFRQNMTKEETIEFVKTGVALAIGRDGSSGGCIRLAVITKDGVQRHFIPGDQVPALGVI